jgi:hypothetical protein
MPRMTKRQFEEMFREEVLPHLAARERSGSPDKPARREAWNNTVDVYIRDGTLPEAAGNWSHPRWLETAQRKRSRDDYATMKTPLRKKSAAQLDREIAEALVDKNGKARSVHATIAAAAPAKPKRVPKTRLIWVVQGNYGYGHGWEDVTAAETWKEAKGYLRDYRENERGVPFRVIRRREKIAA